MQKIVKHISWPILPKKKKVEKIANLGLKPWVYPFGKILIFRLFQLVVFIAQKGVFFLLEYRKRHYLGLYCLKKKPWKNDHFLDQSHGLTPLVKCQFFHFSNFFFYIYSLETRFYVLEYRKRRFPGLYFLKKKVGKNGHFLTKSKGYPLSKNEIFFHFLNLLFLLARMAFFRSRIS